MTIDQFISWAALLFSGIAIIISLRAHRKQAPLLDREMAEYERTAQQRVQATLSVALLGNTIVITNHGPAEARYVNLIFLDGRSPLPQGEAEEKLPTPVLQPTGTLTLIAATSHDCHPPFPVLLSWRDGTGDRTQEATLT